MQYDMVILQTCKNLQSADDIDQQLMHLFVRLFPSLPTNAGNVYLLVIISSHFNLHDFFFSSKELVLSLLEGTLDCPNLKKLGLSLKEHKELIDCANDSS